MRPNAREAPVSGKMPNCQMSFSRTCSVRVPMVESISKQGRLDDLARDIGVALPVRDDGGEAASAGEPRPCRPGCRVLVRILNELGIIVGAAIEGAELGDDDRIGCGEESPRRLPVSRLLA